MNEDKIIEIAIQGHASTRDAIRWAMKQAYMDGVESGITAEREACAKVCDGIRYSGYCPPEDGSAPEYYDEAAEECAEAIRARGIDAATVGEVGVWGEK